MKTYNFASKQIGPVIYGLSTGYKLTLVGNAIVEATTDIEGAENGLAIWKPVQFSDGVSIVTAKQACVRVSAIGQCSLTIEDGSIADLIEYQQSSPVTNSGVTVSAKYNNITGGLKLQGINLHEYDAASTRPYLVAWGNSIEAQNYPSDASAALPDVGWQSASPMGWCNAACRAAFDLLGPFSVEVTPTGGNQTVMRPYTNGVWGYSGGQVRHALTYAVPQLIAETVSRTNGRPWWVLLDGAENDMSDPAADTAGHGQLVFDAYKAIFAQIKAAGGKVLLRFGAPSWNFATDTRLRNVEQLERLLRAYVETDDNVVLMDAKGAYRKYTPSIPHSTRTRSGDKIHPNALGALVLGLGYADALEGRVVKAPPWEMGSVVTLTSNPGGFRDTASTGGTKGTNAHASSVVPTGWTLVSYGAVTTVLSDREVYDQTFGLRCAATVTGANNVHDTVAVFSANPAGISTSKTYRTFAEVMLVSYSADQLTAATPRPPAAQVRNGAAGWKVFPALSSSDIPNDAAVEVLRLLAGRPMVYSSNPFVPPDTTQGSVRVDISAGLKANTLSAAVTAVVGYCGTLEI